jgi:hypothetical protein
MAWETPSMIDIEMNAEIGAYQEDDGGERPEPIVENESPENGG